MLFHVIFILFLGYGSGIVEIAEQKLSRTCHIHKVDFWKFYYWLFDNSYHVYISSFDIEGNSQIIPEFLNEILLHIAGHGLYKKSFTISQYVLDDYEELQHDCEPHLTESYSENDKENINSETEIKNEMNSKKGICQENKFNEIKCPTNSTNATIVYVTLEEVLEAVAEVKKTNETVLQRRIRSFSVDENYRYIIMVQSQEDLKRHLDEDWSKVFPNPRGIYSLIFISTKELTPENLEELFYKFWSEYSVFNIIIQQPCTCLYKDLHTYDPFYLREDNTWGLVKKFNVDDAIDSPEYYRRSLQQLNGHPLKISLFNRLPTAVAFLPQNLNENPIYQDLSRSLGFSGIDGMVLKTLCERLDLTPVLASSERDYGYELNGKYYGSLGEVSNRTIDASFNSRYMEGIGQDVIEYLTPLINDKFCIIVPKALEIPHYLMIFHCFTWRSWLLIFSTYLIASSYWCFVRPISFQTSKSSKNVSLSYLEIFGLFVSVSIPIKLVSCPHQRVFFVSCMIFNIVVIGSFQGSLTTSFSTTSHYPDIDTLVDFEKSGLYIKQASRSIMTVFGDDGSELFHKLAKRIQFVPKLSNAFRNISIDRNLAAMERRADAILKIKMYFTTNDGVELIHVANECPRSYHYTYIVPKGSPYVHVFNIIIKVLQEAGMLLKWNSDIVDASILEMRYKNAKLGFSDKTEEPFSLADMKIAFCVHIAGSLVSFFVFLIEMIPFVGYNKCKFVK